MFLTAYRCALPSSPALVNLAIFSASSRASIWKSNPSRTFVSGFNFRLASVSPLMVESLSSGRTGTKSGPFPCSSVKPPTPKSSAVTIRARCAARLACLSFRAASLSACFLPFRVTSGVGAEVCAEDSGRAPFGAAGLPRGSSSAVAWGAGSAGAAFSSSGVRVSTRWPLR